MLCRRDALVVCFPWGSPAPATAFAWTRLARIWAFGMGMAGHVIRGLCVWMSGAKPAAGEEGLPFVAACWKMSRAALAAWQLIGLSGLLLDGGIWQPLFIFLMRGVALGGGLAGAPCSSAS